MVRDNVDTDDNIGVHESIRIERSQESEGEKLDDFTNTSDGGGKEFVGTIEERDGAVVSFNVLGTVTRVYAEEGQMVKKGQALAEVDGQNVRSSYEMSASTLRQAEDAYKRLSTLYERGTLPEIRMVEMETQLAKDRRCPDEQRRHCPARHQP